MLIRDALYGEFSIPSYLDDLISTPEFRRLNEVRLININSPSLASLADVRRYSHTLGVLYLALQNSLIDLGHPEYKAFLASIIVHDAGTPAFAHLFEYCLSEKYGWNHEDIISDILTVHHHSDGPLHQIYHSQTPNFHKYCKKNRIDFDIVLDFVQKKHYYSKLIFGSIDFDNIDNVARMNWMIGNRFNVESLKNIARNISVNRDGVLVLSQEFQEDILKWMELREFAYRILIFDAPTVAGQAVLSKAISLAIEIGHLNHSDWHYDDNKLILALSNSSADVKNILHLDFFVRIPELCLSLNVKDKEGIVKFSSATRKQIGDLITEFLYNKLGKNGRYYGYIFRDKGSFSKRMQFFCPVTKDAWSIGQRSDSVILYGFVGGGRHVKLMPEQLGKEFREWVEARL